MDKEIPNAKLTIRNAAKMTPKERDDIVAWLLNAANTFKERADRLDANYSAMIFLPKKENDL